MIEVEVKHKRHKGETHSHTHTCTRRAAHTHTARAAHTLSEAVWQESENSRNKVPGIVINAELCTPREAAHVTQIVG